MQRLALESNTITEDVDAALGGVSEAAGRVSGGLGQATAGALSTRDAVAEGMRRTILELHSSSESSYSRVSQISASGAGLVRDIAKVRGGLTAGPLFAGVIARAVGELERLSAQAGPASLEGPESPPTGQLESLAQRYTMQMERDVHESVARGSSPQATPATEVGTPLEDGDFGDNVELF